MKLKKEERICVFVGVKLEDFNFRQYVEFLVVIDD